MSKLNDELLGEVYDVLQYSKRTIKLYQNKGSVDLIDCSPRLCPIGRKMGYSAARAARTSYGSGLKTPKQDQGLVNYLVRNYHTSPLEFMSFTFKITCPIFVARQIMRHRMASVNEVSARYTVLKPKFFIPPFDGLRINNKLNKQSSGGSIKDEKEQKEIIDIYVNSYNEIYKNYEKLLELKVARELARSILPVGIFTEFYITMNVNNFLKFLKLRMADDCQYETRIVADAMFNLAYPLCPTVFDAWKCYSMESLMLSEKEISAIKNRTDTLENGSKGEQTEYDNKLNMLKSEVA